MAHTVNPRGGIPARRTGRRPYLRPLGRAYGAIARRRYQRAAPYRSKRPVICVGNFTAGGTGKTPMSLSDGRYRCRLRR